MENLTKYLDDKFIEYILVDNDRLIINNQSFLFIRPNSDNILFDENFEITSDFNKDIDFLIFFFGQNYYYSSVEKIDLIDLRYIGKHKYKEENGSFLGIRSGTEILNGVGQYSNWIRKAKFLGKSTLALAEKNTLAGIVEFQSECLKNEIKTIIGATYTVYDKKSDYRFDVKLYVKDEQGWLNILRINSQVKVFNISFVNEEFLLDHLDGLILVIDPKSLDFDKISHQMFNKVSYYQLDTVIYSNEERDKEYLLNLKSYLLSELEPISIFDAFYLEREDFIAKQLLNKTAGFHEYESSNQYFKSKMEYYLELESLLGEDKSKYFFAKAINNEINLIESCSYNIPLDKFHLPKYKLTSEQKLKYKNSNDLFWSIILHNFKKKVQEDKKEIYLVRLEREMNLIMQGNNLVDYFLILWDIIEWCRSNDILVGVGRGSSAGSLVAYLLNIVEIDPIQYGLLFERFLNENRVNKSLPDIDSDFEGARRDDIKRYMEHRFGQKQVCSVGTYANLKMKVIISDLCRLHNVDFVYVKLITKILDDMESKGENWTDIFKLAVKNQKLKEFVNKYPEIINVARLILMQPRSESIHACATLILPDDKPIYDWIPVKRMNLKDGEETLVTEWEGIYLDKAGFLKEDILGVTQLDKFADMIKSIYQEYGIKINIEEIPREDQNVYEFFSNGFNEDIFQFGTKGLKKYCRQVKPHSLEELIAINALYRPGAMKSNAHNDFVDIKFGKKNIEYDYMLEGITKETYGLYLYQEQTMLAAEKLGGFTLTEADMLRKVMVGHSKKQEKDKFEFYKNKFVEGAINNNCDKKEAEKIWDKLEAFAGYGFNRSHASAYALTGYIGQWFKVNYPLHFWSTAFKFASEDNIPNYISEINQTGKIKIKAPDINKSSSQVITDFKSETIFWSLTSIKGVGEKASEEIMNERNSSGQYFSFEDFLERHSQKGTKVNKTVIESLIACGCFDDIELIESPKDRIKLIKQYRDKKHVKVDQLKDKYAQSREILTNWWWLLKQKELSGFALFDYESLCYFYLSHKIPFFNESTFFDEDSSGSSGCIGGYVAEVEEREISKGTMLKLTLESNFTFINVVVWPEQFDQFGIDSDILKGKIVLISGKIVYDKKYKKENSLQTFEKSEFIILS